MPREISGQTGARPTLMYRPFLTTHEGNLIALRDEVRTEEDRQRVTGVVDKMFRGALGTQVYTIAPQAKVDLYRVAFG